LVRFPLRFGWILLFIGVYFAAGAFGLSLAFAHASASAVWPPTGIALAALLLWGYRLWPAVFTGAFLVNYYTQGALASSLGIATGNTLEAILGAWLVRRFASGPAVFERAQDICRFVVLAALFSTAVSATLGVTSLCLDGSAHWNRYGAIWVTWWLGDLVSNLTVAPLLVIWLRSSVPRWESRRLLEAGLLFALTCVLGLIVFFGHMTFEFQNLPVAYLTIPVLVWAAFRFGRRGAATFTILRSKLHPWTAPLNEACMNESLQLTEQPQPPNVTLLAVWRKCHRGGAVEQRPDFRRRCLRLKKQLPQPGVYVVNSKPVDASLVITGGRFWSNER
jgi:integral membrane sensor domain MASE1